MATPPVPGVDPRLLPNAGAKAAAAKQGNQSPVSRHWTDLKLPCPGPYENLHNQTKNVFATTHFFDGMKFMVNKPLSHHLQIGHQLHLGASKQPQSYHYNVTYIHPGATPEEGNPILLGDLDMDGNLMAQCIAQLTKSCKAKVQGQFSGPNYSVQAEVDYQGVDSTLNIKTVNPTITQEAGLYLFNYFQSVTPSIAMGVEAMYQYGNKMQESALNFAARYRTKTCTLALNASPNGALQATYFHRVNKNVSLATELELNVRNKESLCTIGYQFDFRQSTFRGQLDSDGAIAAVLEQKMAPMVSFLLTGTIDHSSGNSRFGFGMVLGQ